MLRYIFILFTFTLIFSCSNETIYSGKILKQENLKNINFKNKKNLLNNMGEPSFIDPIENKFFYFTQKKNKKSIFTENIEYSYIFVFKFDENEKIINSQVFDLKETTDIQIIKNKTENQIVERGLLERIFGGIGPQDQLPNSP